MQQQGEQTRVLIEVRLDRAREDIETARELFNLGRYRAVVNRSYYAIFSVTTALLLTQRIERSKHAGVESAFIQNIPEYPPAPSGPEALWAGGCWGDEWPTLSPGGRGLAPWSNTKYSTG